MHQPPALSPLQRDALRSELSRDDLSIYAVVRLARKDVEVGHFDAAISRLRVDADKLRAHGSVLNELIQMHGKPGP